MTLEVLSISEDTPEPPDPRDLDIFIRFLAENENAIPARPRTRKPVLEKRITKDGGDLHDDDWMSEHAGQYVTAVELIRSKNLEAPGRSSTYSRKVKRWKHEDELAQAEFRLTVADPAYAAHLEPGEVWESCAYAAGLWSDGDEEEEEEEGDEGAVEKAAPERAPATPARTLASQLEAIDAAFAAAGIPTWRTSGLVDDQGYVQIVVNDKDLTRAIAAGQSAGFQVRDRRSGWLQDGATGLMIGRVADHPPGVVTFVVGGRKEKSKKPR